MSEKILERAREYSRQASRRYRDKHPERVRKSRRRWREDNPAKAQRNDIRRWAAYRKRHPDRRIAQNTISHAIRDGKLVRQPCEICGDPKSEGHHPDYSKPLDVVWFCRQHHVEEHKKLSGGIEQ